MRLAGRADIVRTFTINPTPKVHFPLKHYNFKGILMMPPDGHLKKAVFEGYYGYRNAGDDSFVEVSAWGARKYWNVAETLFLGSDLPKTSYNTSGLRQQRFRGQNRFETMYHVFTGGIFLSAGGSTFEATFPWHHARGLALLRKRLRDRIPIGAIGVSIGPYRNMEAERQYREYLKHLDFVAVRDTRSFELVSSYALPYKPIDAFDLAALLPLVYGNPERPLGNQVNKVIGVSICHYERYERGMDQSKERKREQYILDLLLRLSRAVQAKFRFIEFNGHKRVGDRSFLRSVMAHLSKNSKADMEFVPYSSDVRSVYNAIADCSLVISTRLHASVFACFSGVPFFLIEYHQKCSDFLDAIHYEPQYRLGDGRGEASSVVELMSEILNDASLYAPPAAIPLCQTKALRNFTEVIF